MRGDYIDVEFLLMCKTRVAVAVIVLFRLMMRSKANAFIEMVFYSSSTMACFNK